MSDSIYMKLARIIGILLQGTFLGILMYLAIVMLWVQTGDGRIFQYQGF
jgi:hypothetical protein